MSNEERIQKARELARAYKLQGYHCSEATIRAVPEALDMKISEDVIKAGCGFFRGGGGTCDRCGVIECCLMLISLLYGRMDSAASDEDIRVLAAELIQRFQTHFGSIYCRILKPNEVAKYGEDFGCMRIYEEGAELVTRLLLDAPQLLAE